MRRFLTGGLFFLGSLGLPVALSPSQTESKIPDYSKDPRLPALRRFFHRMAAPAEELASVFLQVADAHRLDWRLLPSLSFVETGGGKGAQNNNLFGWDSGRTKFGSLAAGIHQVGYHLSHAPAYRGKKLDTVLAIYNPNGGYARAVKDVMRRISPKE